ncbi:MAG: hypothetical protein IJC73_03205 [Lentisphaeria bacterium]|nr:hypothetical protein [Lentisphaeria bacterium]
MDRQQLLAAVEANLVWFRQSGIMDPADGSWGVGERVLLTQENEALEKACHAFPAWTPKDGAVILEHRRADCNFEAALLYRMAAEATGRAEYRQVAQKLLDYLFFRSGLLLTGVGGTQKDVWQWSHITHYPAVYFDDNAWCLLIQLIFADDPEWAERYQLLPRAEALADRMCAAARRTFMCGSDTAPDEWRDPAGSHGWAGDMRQPHWSSLACMALAAAYGRFPKPEYAVEIRRYCDYIDGNLAEWNTSELSYAVIGAAFANHFLKDGFYEGHLKRLGEKLLGRQDAVTGNFPSEHESETPVGPEKVDTIYTVNWALPALQCLWSATGEERYRAAAERVMELLLAIQDTDPSPLCNGCWRGMFDLNTRQWGGGNRFEGGAASIYSGWTNAPISVALLLAREDRCLVDLL